MVQLHLGICNTEEDLIKVYEPNIEEEPMKRTIAHEGYTSSNFLIKHYCYEIDKN
jgi:transcriptional regulator of NAD metabolism